jgi:tetratricopeptide (TPR) repeat protein
MPSFDLHRVRSLFDRALELPPDERAAFLDSAAADATLKAEVESLLRAASEAGPLDALGQRLSSIRDVLTETPPERAGPYVVDAPIGRGGMGVVYRAHDPRLARDVALKFLQLTTPTDSTDVERLTAEARTASALDHPNICTIFDIGSLDDGRVFIAMAYYPRGTLEDRLAHGPLPVVDAVRIARQLADALDCAHAAGIVHRDIKPANVAFDERGVVKVLDFGVAVLDHGGGTTSGTAGTPSYMAPEQADGDAVDARSDVWAVGVLLYEMLTGVRPFTGDTRADVLARIRSQDPPDLLVLRPETPAAVAAIATRALARNPEHRFASAAALRDALDTSLPAGTPPLRLRPRHAATAVTLTALMLAAAFIANTNSGGRADGFSGDAQLDEQFERGRQRFKEGSPESIEAAAVILRSVVERDSTHTLARAFLAKAYALSTGPSFSRERQSEWLDSALVHAAAAVRLAPQAPQGYAALGVTYHWLGRLDDALEQQHRALAHDPQHALSLLEIGTIHIIRRERAEAIPWLERGLELDPGALAARQHLATIYRSYRLHDEARRHLALGRAAAPDHTSLLWESVILELEAGDTAAARRDFDQYIQLLSTGERDRMRAWFELLQGDNEAALEYIDRLDLVRAPWYDLRVFGVAYQLAGRHEAGTAMLRRAIRGVELEHDAPDWPAGASLFHLAYVRAALGEYEAALASMQNWVDAGGVRPWDVLEREPGWGPLVQDPQFQEIMRRSEEAYLEARAGIMEALRRFRDA